MVAVSQFSAPREVEPSPLSGLHMTPPRWAFQDATLRDSEASLWSAYDTIPLGPPGAHENCDSSHFTPPETAMPYSDPRRTSRRSAPEANEGGDSFAVRGPQGRRGFILICV